MNCKCCGFPCDQQFSVCPVCGEVMEPAPLALPAPKKSRARMPFLVLLALLVAGHLLYFLIPMDTSEIPVVTEVPPSVQETAPDAMFPSENKTLFQKDCFILEDGVLSFDESKFIANPILIVPAAIDEQPVQVISAHCFENLQGVTTIVLPSSITLICDYAFAGCVDLRGICVPNAVTAIGREAFRGCKSLEAVYIPTGLVGIGAGAFDDCPKLLFLFYNGFYEQWLKVYDEDITPFTWVIAWDGEYRHKGKTG